jgi:hypothetical protein
MSDEQEIERKPEAAPEIPAELRDSLTVELRYINSAGKVWAARKLLRAEDWRQAGPALGVLLDLQVKYCRKQLEKAGVLEV